MRRVGGLERLPLDIRFLFISSRDLHRAVEERSFRRDLLYRLSGVEVRVPPLRERRDDIPLLARHLLERHARRLGIAVPVIESAVLARLREETWRGNVRELEGFLLRLLLSVPESGAIAVADVEALLHRPEKSEASSPLLHRKLEDWRADLERDYLTQLFLASEGNVRRMAEHLAIGRTALYGWFRKLGLDLPSLRKELGETGEASR